MESLLVSRSEVYTESSLFSGGYRVAVTEVSARLTLVSGAKMPASFFLEAGTDIYEHEGLLAHLNNTRKQFIVVRCEAGITMVCADAIAYVRIGGRTTDFEFCEVIGTPHQAAHIRLCTGEELRGDFVCLARPDRSRLSDLLNQPGQRFLLFTSGSATYLIHRNALQQVDPL